MDISVYHQRLNGMHILSQAQLFLPYHGLRTSINTSCSLFDNHVVPWILEVEGLLLSLSAIVRSLFSVEGLSGSSTTRRPPGVFVGATVGCSVGRSVEVFVGSTVGAAVCGALLRTALIPITSNVLAAAAVQCGSAQSSLPHAPMHTHRVRSRADEATF